MLEGFNGNLINLLLYSILKVLRYKGAYYEKENRY